MKTCSPNDIRQKATRCHRGRCPRRPAPAQANGAARPIRRRPGWFCARINGCSGGTEFIGGRWTKVPYTTGGHHASSTDPRPGQPGAMPPPTRPADGTASAGELPEDGLTGTDLDKCRDPATGELQPWAADIIKTLDTYTKVGPAQPGRVLSPTAAGETVRQGAAWNCTTVWPARPGWGRVRYFDGHRPQAQFPSNHQRPQKQVARAVRHDVRPGGPAPHRARRTTPRIRPPPAAASFRPD